MALLPEYVLTVYQEDDSTELFAVGTDPAHAKPYLKAPTQLDEQEVEFAKGAVSIGQLNVEIVDVLTDPTDQNTGYITSQLADVAGYSQLNGHRALLTEDLGGGFLTVLDGVVRSVRLLDNFVTYQFELRDIRERERKTKAFATTSTPTIIPRGVLNGYGVQVPGGGIFPIPATEPELGTYRLRTSTYGLIEFGGSIPLTPPMMDALQSIGPLAGSPEVLVYDRFKVLWRDTAGGGGYTTIDNIAHTHSGLAGGGGMLSYVGSDFAIGLNINNLVDSGTLPSNGQAIDVIVQYDGPVTEDWEFHLQNLTVGDLIGNAYDGDYSEEDPRIRYDAAAVAAMTTPVRLRLGKPVDDLRAWLEKNAYPIEHAAPVLDASGDVSPINYLLPDVSVTLVDLTDANCRPAGAGWNHGSEDAINLVKVKYLREYRVSPSDDATQLALSDQIKTREVIVEHRITASIDLIGEQPLEIDSVLLRAIGSVDGGPRAGDVADEVGAAVAARVTRMATDRFAQGGQYFAMHGLRSDSDIEGLVAGSWVAVGVSWMPDYLSGERGLARLAQITSRRNIDAAWTSFTMIDAGSANAPLAVPILGTLTVDTAGVVSIPIFDLGDVGSEVRIDYAVNDTEPAAGSALWTFLGRFDATVAPPGVTTPPLPAGEKCWIRGRAELEGRRPSIYVDGGPPDAFIVIPSTPRVIEAAISIDDNGIPTVSWVPNSFCLGVEIHYEVHSLATVPTFGDSVEADATDLSKVITGISVGDPLILTVQVEPFPTYTPPVGGTPGPVVEVNSIAPVLPTVGFDEAGADLDDDGTDLDWTLSWTFIGDVNTTDHELRFTFWKNGAFIDQDLAVAVDEAQPYTYDPGNGNGGGLTSDKYHVTMAIISKATGLVVGATVDVHIPDGGGTILNETILPDADVAVNAWTPTPLWQENDADDSNFTQFPVTPEDLCPNPVGSDKDFIIGLANPSAFPAGSATQKLTIKAEASQQGADDGCLTVKMELLEDPSGAKTVRASFGPVAVNPGPTTLSDLLTDGQYDSIVDHDDLGIRITANIGHDVTLLDDKDANINYCWAVYEPK